ncbi:MAG: SMP-30/gluconolactonase/LRE family protein [Maribacter sp.]|uniref:SMP-30/gluconolactonase/LRE family protein n=1 Tax=Maribacter sp. TaxID=1897614 RepID=UPI0032999390
MRRTLQNNPLLLLPLLFVFGCKAQVSSIIKNDAKLTLVADSFDFTEGPAVDKNGDVYFTDQPNNRIVKWDASENSVSDWMKPSGRSNGLYFDHGGNLLSCADEKNELWRIDMEKNATVLVDNFEGKLLGGPNDLWVDPDGGIYFTDPLYERPWWEPTTNRLKERRVYYITPSIGEVRIVAEGGYVQPNGIIGSADGKTLYIADNGAKKTYAFTINADGNLSNRVLFADMGSDGMTLDNEDNVYLTGDGVTVFDKSGKQIEHIQVPEKWTANVTFGGPNQDILFITAMDSVYTLEMKVNGVR